MHPSAQPPRPTFEVDPFDREGLRVLVGPTASGKSELALAICEHAGAEIISLDSMQVYQGMDIGTAKPTAEELARVPHHMIDLVGTDEVFDVQRFMQEARKVLADLQERKTRALFVGGTGFYLAALLRGLFQGPPVDRKLRGQLEARAESEGHEALFRELLHADPESAGRIHHNDVRRVIRALEVWYQTGRRLSDWQQEWNDQTSPREAQARLVGLSFSVPMQDRRIRERTKRMLAAGWVEEAVRLREQPGLGPGAIQALGYDTVLELADGKIDSIQALDLIALRTRQFARRQRTWYRKFAIQWIEGGAPDRLDRALQHLGWA